MWNIFEYPFAGIVAAFAVMIAMWFYRMFCPAKKKKWQLAVPFIIAIASVGLCVLVQTDKEKIVRVIGTGITAFENQQVEPIKKIVSDDYADAAHSNKELIVAYCQALFETMMVENITTIKKETTVEDNKGNFTTEVLVKFTEDSEIAKMGKAYLIVKARFYLKKNPQDKWQIHNCDILELDRKPVNWNQLRGS